MDVREVIADMIFILRAPVDGIEQAMGISGKYSKAWQRLATLLRALPTPWVLPRSYRRELIGIASTYYSAGSDPGITFMALYNKYNTILNQWSDWQYNALLAIISISIMVGLLSILVVLGAPPLLPLINLFLIPAIHYYQVEITRYDYTLPTITGVAGGIAGVGLAPLLGLGVTGMEYLGLMGLGIGFAVTYLPQFARFVRNYMGLESRVMTSFGELLTVHNPRPPRPLTLIEHQLTPLWEYAFSVGVREFIERVNMMVDTLLTFVRRSVNAGLIYGPFVPISYASILYIYSIIRTLGTVHLPVPLIIQPQAIGGTILPLAIGTSLLTGKAIHSIGLGIVLLPLFLIPAILILGW